MNFKRVRTVLLITMLFTQSTMALKVNFEMPAVDFSVEPAKSFDCEFENILKHRPSKNPTEPSIPTIVLNEKTSLAPDQVKFCQKVFTNLTQLDQQKVRDDIARVLLDMNCKPDAEIYVEFRSTENNRASSEYPGILHSNIVNKVSIEGCLDEELDLCRFPSRITSWDATSQIIDHEKMMTAFKDCRDAVNEKVDEEGLLEKWQAANDPNATKGSKAAEHKKAFISEN